MSTPARLLEQLASDVLGGADAGRGKRQLSGLSLGERKQIRDALRRHLVVDRKDARHYQNAGNRREIAHRIEGGTRLQRRVDSHCAVGPPIEGAAVWDRFCHPLGPDTPAGARNILDGHRHFPRLIELLREQAGCDVGRAAGSEADDDADRPQWITLRRCHQRRGRQRGNSCRQMQKLSAGKFHVALPKYL